MAENRPRRRARAEVDIERNTSDGQKFVRIKVWEHYATGSRVKMSGVIDEGTAFQLGEKLQACLARLDAERER